MAREKTINVQLFRGSLMDRLRVALEDTTDIEVSKKFVVSSKAMEVGIEVKRLDAFVRLSAERDEPTGQRKSAAPSDLERAKSPQRKKIDAVIDEALGELVRECTLELWSLLCQRKTSGSALRPTLARTMLKRTKKVVERTYRERLEARVMDDPNITGKVEVGVEFVAEVHKFDRGAESADDVVDARTDSSVLRLRALSDLVNMTAEVADDVRLLSAALDEFGERDNAIREQVARLRQALERPGADAAQSEAIPELEERIRRHAQDAKATEAQLHDMLAQVRQNDKHIQRSRESKADGDLERRLGQTTCRPLLKAIHRIRSTSRTAGKSLSAADAKRGDFSARVSSYRRLVEAHKSVREGAERTARALPLPVPVEQSVGMTTSRAALTSMDALVEAARLAAPRAKRAEAVLNKARAKSATTKAKALGRFITAKATKALAQ